MTLSKAAHAERRERAPRAQRLTMVSDLVAALAAQLERENRITWPAPKYRRRYVDFARDILGIDPWSKQREILEAVARFERVAVKSGHRVSKSNTASIIALCDYCSIEDVRVIMSAPTARQVDEILWLEIQKRSGQSGRCVACIAADPHGHRISTPCPHSAVIEGKIGSLARTGLRSTTDYRQVFGFTAREGNAVTGLAAANMTFIFDEAPGIPQSIFDANEGNRAGGARIVLFGNPTENSGEFYEAFHSKQYDEKTNPRGYVTLTVSSEQSPNITGERQIKGLADADWVAERKAEWGETSPQYIVRVRGEFAKQEEGRIFSVGAITAAEQRWVQTEAKGRLYIGLDPASATGTGDESVFCTRRGLKVLAFQAHRGLNADAHIVNLLGLIAEHKVPREMPVVVFDREGSVGAELYGSLRAYLANQKVPPFQLVAIRASDRAIRKPQTYDRMRDELAYNLEVWLRDGGALPEHAKLSGEMHEMRWASQASGRLKVTPKDEVKKALGRSPDHYDALALSCWEPLSLRDDVPTSTAAITRREVAQLRHDPQTGMPDPYAGWDDPSRR